MSYIQDFKDKGWCVINNVVNPQDYIDEFWNWIESFNSGVERNDPLTWFSSNWPPCLHGILQHFQIGHAEFLWKLRCEDNIIKAFQTIYQTDDLLVSFDGANATRPSKKRKTKNWGHIDQRQSKVGFNCVQGCVTFTKTDTKFVVLSGSHNLHQEFFKIFPSKIGKKDWVKMNIDEYNWYIANGATEVYITAEPGDLVLWDSRIVHWVISPTDTVRLAGYVSYEPRNRATVSSLKKKQKYFLEGRTTSHWAAHPKVNPKKFQHFNHPELLEKFKDRPIITNPSKKVLHLAGFN
jgi:hypothetical protein